MAPRTRCARRTSTERLARATGLPLLRGKRASPRCPTTRSVIVLVGVGRDDRMAPRQQQRDGVLRRTRTRVSTRRDAEAVVRPRRGLVAALRLGILAGDLAGERRNRRR